MTVEVTICEEFGPFCGDGEKAAEFRFRRIDPFIDSAEAVRFDFSGVRNINSSFANALVANLVSRFSPHVISKLQFLNCKPTVQLMIESALNIGLNRWKQKADLATVA